MPSHSTLLLTTSLLIRSIKSSRVSRPDAVHYVPHDSIVVNYSLAAPLPFCSFGKCRGRRCVAALRFVLELQSALTSIHEWSNLNEMVDVLQSRMVATLDSFAPLRARFLLTTGAP
ncbi:hypothetical protein TKK_0016064 [Trichogramma kaykai]